MIPTFIFQIWLFGLCSVGLVGAAVYLAREWSLRCWIWDPILQRSVFAPDFGLNVATGILAAAIVAVTIALFGRSIVKAAFILLHANTPTDRLTGIKAVEEKRITRPDGSSLRVRLYGSKDDPAIVCTHGWGLNSNEWNYLLPKLAEDFRVITWDLPGLGRSDRPKNNDYRLERLAEDLQSVLASLGDRSATLLGHSIGGMITLTFCRLFPELLGNKVDGLILVHTTPTNPVRTTRGSSILLPIQQPVLVPLMYLTIAASPLLWVLNWLSYFNGSAHLSTMRGSFAGTESWEKVEFATHFQAIASPAVLARGMLAMMKYDARQVLPTIPIATLVVVGDLDTTTKPEAGREIESIIPCAELATLSPAKHLGHLEHNPQFAKLVRERVFRVKSLDTKPRTAGEVIGR